MTNLTNPDPLGIGARQRAADANQRFRNQQQGVSFGHIGPLSDPMWDAFKQILSESNARVRGPVGTGKSQYDVRTVDPAVRGLSVGGPGVVQGAQKVQPGNFGAVLQGLFGAVKDGPRYGR